MATIKNFSTKGGSVTLSLDISNVHVITPILTTVRLDVFDGERFYSIPIPVPNNNTGDILPYTIGEGINYRHAILVFETSFKYENADSLSARIRELNVLYTLSENGVVKTFRTFDGHFIAPQKKIVKIVKNISLS